ncbi:MAG TPA: S8 family serine peptidase [Acidimicrobiia bacterium]|nr:S8 family serine peptidase [Acidimicrobiia bacterium]
MKRSFFKIVLLLVVVFCGVSTNAQQVFASEPGSVDQAVKQLLQAGKPADVWINILDVATPLQESFTSDVQTKQAINNWANSVDSAKKKIKSKLKTTNLVRDYKYVPVIQAQLNSPAELNAVLESGSNIYVSLPPVLEVTADAQSMTLIKSAPSLNDGRNGAGTEVAVIDDTGNHGNNVAAIVKDVAPGANVVRYDLNDILGSTTRIIARKARGVNVVAVNMSFHTAGISFSFGECTNTGLDAVIASLVAVDILPVAASGNEAQNTRLNSPACLPGVVAVGATYDQSWNINWTYPADGERLIPCTDRAPLVKQPTCFTNVSRDLDVWAPGHNITAGGITMSGTSQATAHVSGAVAMLRQAVPSANNFQVTKALKSAGKPITFRGVTRRFLNVRGATNALFTITIPAS